MMRRSRTHRSVVKYLAAATMSALAVVVAVGSLSAPASAENQHPKGIGGPKIAAIKACAEKNGITLNSLAALKQLSTAQRTALKQCVASNSVTLGPKIAAIKACAEKNGVTLNSLAASSSCPPRRSPR